MSEKWSNTGKLRFRLTPFKRKCVLQVEQYETFYKHWRRWKDASFFDLQEVLTIDGEKSLNELIDATSNKK